jgi:hypothetical protein
MKPQYKPERQRIDENDIFCHGKSYQGHKDIIMASFKALDNEQLNQSSSGAFTYPLVRQREATNAEIKAYCLKK